MRYRVKLVAIFNTVANRNAAGTWLQNKLAERPRFDGDGSAFIDELGRPGIVAMIRYDGAADADWLEGALKTKAQEAGVIAARVSVHECKHDEPPDQWRDCRTIFREWTR